MALRPEDSDDWRARATYARRKASSAETAEDRQAWLVIARDCDERAMHPCALEPSAKRVRAEIPHVQQMAQGADAATAARIEELVREMRGVAGTLDALSHRQERRARR